MNSIRFGAILKPKTWLAGGNNKDNAETLCKIIHKRDKDDKAFLITSNNTSYVVTSKPSDEFTGDSVDGFYAFRLLNGSEGQEARDAFIAHMAAKNKIQEVDPPHPNDVFIWLNDGPMNTF